MIQQALYSVYRAARLILRPRGWWGEATDGHQRDTQPIPFLADLRKSHVVLMLKHSHLRPPYALCESLRRRGGPEPVKSRSQAGGSGHERVPARVVGERSG